MFLAHRLRLHQLTRKLVSIFTTAALTALAPCLFSSVCAVRASRDAPDWAHTGGISMVRLHRAENWQGPFAFLPFPPEKLFYMASLKSSLCWLVGNYQQFDEKFNRSHGWKGPLMTAKKPWHLLQPPPESVSVLTLSLTKWKINLKPPTQMQPEYTFSLPQIGAIHSKDV